MSSPLPVFDKYGQTATLLDWEPDNVIPLKQSDDHQADGIKAAALGAALDGFKTNHINRDNKLFDYLLLGVLSILVHNSIIDHFKGVSFEQEIVPQAKPENKVQITLTRPQPKPVAPPPPQVQAKPPVPKVVPLKPQKPKPVKKVVEQQLEPTPVTTQVSDSAPTATGPVSNAPPVEEKITPPKGGAGYLNNPPPEYPELAINRGWEGKVVLNIHVSADGKPISANVLKSSGHMELDDSALKIVKVWSFTPAKRGETPTDGWVTVPINFAL